MTVAAFTGGRDVPSARVRVRQLIPGLLEHGVRVVEFVSRFGSFPPTTKAIRPLWAIASLGGRVPDIAWSHTCDVTLLQREFLSTFATLEFLTKRPRVLDVDDAIFLFRGGRHAARLAGQCDLVICGNDYLAERFAHWNDRVVVVPTGVDVDRFVPGTRTADARPVVIGWIGTSSNLRYLCELESMLGDVLRTHPHSRLTVVSNVRPELRSVPAHQVNFVPWSAENELESVQGMDIGIMPLEDSEWERGKCSYKMLQYMACALPVVVTPVGMNAQVLSIDDVGIGASTPREWRDGLTSLLDDRVARTTMGQAGRRVVERHFSLQVIVPRLAGHLRAVAS